MRFNTQKKKLLGNTTPAIGKPSFRRALEEDKYPKCRYAIVDIIDIRILHQYTDVYTSPSMYREEHKLVGTVHSFIIYDKQQKMTFAASYLETMKLLEDGSLPTLDRVRCEVFGLPLLEIRPHSTDPKITKKWGRMNDDALIEYVGRPARG